MTKSSAYRDGAYSLSHSERVVSEGSNLSRAAEVAEKTPTMNSAKYLTHDGQPYIATDIRCPEPMGKQSISTAPFDRL